MTDRNVYVTLDLGSKDEDIIAAHVYRNQRIVCTVLIERVSERTYQIYRPGKAVVATTGSLTEAKELADMYLMGYEAAQNDEPEEAPK